MFEKYFGQYWFPIKTSKVLDTFSIYYKPRLYTYINRIWFNIEQGDTLWIKQIKVEKIDTSTVKDLRFYYPIYVNPSDNIASFALPPCHVYLDTDSNLVVGTVTVSPWSSKILIYQKCDTTLSIKKENFQIYSKVLIYPNPVQDWLQVYSSCFGTFELMDINGREILRGQVKTGENKISFLSYPAGVYILRIRDKSSSYKDGKDNVHCFKVIKVQ